MIIVTVKDSEFLSGYVKKLLIKTKGCPLPKERKIGNNSTNSSLLPVFHCGELRSSVPHGFVS